MLIFKILNLHKTNYNQFFYDDKCLMKTCKRFMLVKVYYVQNVNFPLLWTPHVLKIVTLERAFNL
jgi:hypothetical protein